MAKLISSQLAEKKAQFLAKGWWFDESAGNDFGHPYRSICIFIEIRNALPERRLRNVLWRIPHPRLAWSGADRIESPSGVAAVAPEARKGEFFANPSH